LGEDENYIPRSEVKLEIDDKNGMYVNKTKINQIGIGSYSSTKRLILD
jgi:hypothetical protein